MPETADASMTLLLSRSITKGGCSQPVQKARIQECDPTKSSLDLMKGILLFMTLLFVFFVFSQPLLSWLLNDVLGLAKDLCKTPAEQITCGSGERYELVAARLGRLDADKALVGCGCEEGILRDWACAANTTSFSISYFISTAPGTGIMAALSFWPVIGMWIYGAGTLGHLACTGTEPGFLNLITNTLVLFQFSYGLFLINTTCIFPWLHTISVVLFNGSAVVHYLAVAYVVGWQTKVGQYLNASSFLGIAAIALGSLYPASPSWFGQHAFWLGECAGLSAGMAIAPILILFYEPSLQVQPATHASALVANV